MRYCIRSILKGQGHSKLFRGGAARVSHVRKHAGVGHATAVFMGRVFSRDVVLGGKLLLWGEKM